MRAGSYNWITLVTGEKLTLSGAGNATLYRYTSPRAQTDNPAQVASYTGSTVSYGPYTDTMIFNLVLGAGDNLIDYTIDILGSYARPYAIDLYPGSRSTVTVPPDATLTLSGTGTGFVWSSDNQFFAYNGSTIEVDSVEDARVFTVTVYNGTIRAETVWDGTVAAGSDGDIYDDADLNTARTFQQLVLSYDQGSGDRSAQLYAAFPALKAFLDVGVKSETLADAALNVRWNAGSEYLAPVTADASFDQLEIEGSVYVSSGCAANVAITNSLITAKAGGGLSSYKVQKDNSDSLYRVTIEDSTLEYCSAASNDVAVFTMERVLSRFSEGDNFKGGTTVADATKVQRIANSWGESCGYNDPAAHGDGIQYSTRGFSRVVAVGFYSAPVAATYSTSSYGLTNALRIDASGAPKLVEQVHCLGMMSAFGSFYPVNISAQQTDSIVRNVTVAHCVFGPATGFRPGSTDAIQIHPSFTDNLDGGLVENVAFIENEVFGYGPVLYAGEDATGIWHWNPLTLDAGTMALWQDLGLLDSGGDPLTGMLRSVAGTITTQAKSTSASGGSALNLDLTDIPDGATVTLHLPGTHYDLEYVAS